MNTLTIHKLCTRCGHTFAKSVLALKSLHEDDAQFIKCGTCPMCVDKLVRRVYQRGRFDIVRGENTLTKDLMDDGSIHSPSKPFQTL